MRLIETYKFRRARKHLTKRLKQNIQHEEKYMYYLSKLQVLYHSYKKYDDNIIQQKFEYYLKEQCLKNAKFYYQEKLATELGEYKNEINKKVESLLLAFKKLKVEHDSKMATLNHKLNMKNGKPKTKFTVK